MALGAGRPRIILLVVSEAAIMLALGIVYGAVGLFLVLRFVEGMLFEISKLDPAVLTVATATLALAAALAILPVGARAISMDPMGVLRRD
jgi:predicted lysophospholipase L1 biosynthesis ABC-type transport system permease subunit